MSNEPKIKKIMAIVFNNRSLNVLSNDALIEQSSRRARAGIVSGQWRASPQNSSRSGLNIVEDGGRALSGSMTSPTNRLLRTRRRRQPRRIFGAVQTRLYGPWACVWTTLSSDVSKRAILPPRSRCCPNRKLYRALSLFPPLFRSRYVEFLHYDSITFEATVLEL